jgi:hypothetical protein
VVSFCNYVGFFYKLSYYVNSDGEE